MDKIDELLSRGVEKIYPSKEELERVLRSGKKLRLYQGFDPSMPSLHLGNWVGVQKLRQFQELDHEVIFLVGDFTGMIGDPSDKSATRAKLTREQTITNSQKWKDQAGKIISFDGSNTAKIMFNSKWLDKVTFKDLLEITSNFTVQQMIERDFFQKRLQEGKPIHLHEFLYPVAVAIDCVEMDVDLEIGGNDQTFNMLMGRNLMAAMKNKEKFVLTTKLLVDNLGNKIGKTTGNALFLDATAKDLFGGIMSFPDEVLALSFELLTKVSMEKVTEVKKRLESDENPMVLKKELAHQIVTELHNKNEADKAQEEFKRVHQKGETPLYDILIYHIHGGENIIDVLVNSKLVTSRSEAKRLIEQKAVEIDNERVLSIKHQLLSRDGQIIKVGKNRFVKIKNGNF